jgi:hypothetical protein
MTQRRGQGKRRFLRVKDFRHGETCERWGIGLQPRGMLAQREEWTRRGVMVFLEQVVDEVRGDRDEVDEEASRHQRADGLLLPWSRVSPSPGAHSGPNVSD